MDSIVKKTGLIFGIIGGVLFAANYIIIWKNEIFSDALYGTILRLFPIIMGIGAQIVSKLKLKNYISFKQGVIAFVICTAIMLSSELIVNYLIYVQIDPEAQERIEEIYQQNKEALEAQGLKAMEEVKRTITFSTLAIQTALSFLIYLIPGMITALAMRKKRPIAQ